MQTDISISIVLPVHNEENNIGILLAEIVAVLENRVQQPYEIIVVDDASQDNSVIVVEKYKNELGLSDHQDRPSYLKNIRLLTQTVRSGQSKALMRGMVAAQGAFIITMDADLQHDPADIPRLLEKMAAFDMVCGVRKNRSDGLARHTCSKIANTFRNLITGDSIHDSGCTFRIIRKHCIEILKPLEDRLFGCELLFYPVMLRRRGLRVGELAVVHRRRTSGKSNYKLIRGRFFYGIAACIKVKRLLAHLEKA
jgi:glycosyltransferase involved in cell wall biosynthesis